MRKILLSILSLRFLFFGCQKKEDVIKIGIAGPMTSDQAKMGMDFKNGVSLAVEEWNNKGGVLGKKIEMIISDDQQGKIAADFVINYLKLKNVAILHDKTTYGQGLADEFKKFLENKVNVVYYGGVVQGERDFKMVLTAIKVKKPELIFFGGIYTEAGLLVKQAKELGLESKFMSGDGTIDPKFIEIAGAPAAEGTFLTFSPDPKNIPSAKDFIDKYRSRYGEIGPYSIYAYDATNIMLAAIKEANSIEGGSIIDKLHSMEFNGAIGKIKFDSKGDVTISPYVVWITKSGKFEEYWKP